MNQKELIQRLAEFSGMAQAIFATSDDDSSVEHISEMLFSNIDALIEVLQSEDINCKCAADYKCMACQQHQFQALHPCNHQWSCVKCGERGE